MTTQPYAVHEESTSTIRQQPQNFLLAYHNGKHWVLDFDLACSVKLACNVTEAFLQYYVKYGSGPNFIKHINAIKTT
jgi:hypothetical protein